MNVQTLIACAVIVCAFLIIRYRQRRQQDEHAYFDALELSDAVQELEKIMEQLENADRMTVDLAACSPGLLHRFFRAQWLSSDGKNRTIDLCARGRDKATRGLEAAARAERDRLNQDAIDLIRALAYAVETGPRRKVTIRQRTKPPDAVEKTVGKTMNSGTAGGVPEHGTAETVRTVRRGHCL